MYQPYEYHSLKPWIRTKVFLFFVKIAYYWTCQGDVEIRNEYLCTPALEKFSSSFDNIYRSSVWIHLRKDKMNYF